MNNFEKLENLLYEYSEIDIDIKGLECQIKIEGVQGISYNDMPGSPNPNIKSSVEIEFDLIEKLKKEKLILETKKESIENMLKKLDSTEYKLIKHRYFEDLTFKEISIKLNMNDNYLMQKRNAIIEKLLPYALKFRLIN